MHGSDYSRITEAILYLEANAGAQPSLAQLAAHIGISESHCHRLFHRWAGITPKDFVQAVTLFSAKAALRGKRSVLHAALDSGLSGPERLHDLFVTVDAVTPGEYAAMGAGLSIRWAIHATPLGEALFAMSKRGLCALYFVESLEEKPAQLARLRADWPKAELLEDPTATAPAAREINRRMMGAGQEPLGVLLKGTPFQIKVWEALLRIPCGDVTSYGEIARAIGAPAACRAVGGAVAANKISYLIPCHRVLRESGAIGGYHWGLPRKRAALVLERLSSRHHLAK